MFGFGRSRNAPMPFRVELRAEDPAALDLDWCYTDRAERLYRTGQRLLGRGFFEEAAEVFERDTRYDRAHYEAHVGRAEALVMLGRTAAAATLLDEVLERYGRNALLGAARGHVFLHEGDFAEALQCVDTARELDPAQAYPWIVAGEALLGVRDGLTHAFNRFETARACAVPWPHAELRVAAALIEWRQAEHAHALLEAQLPKHSDLPLTWVLLGRACDALGRSARAREAWQTALQLAPDLPPARYALGWRRAAAFQWYRLRTGWRRLARKASAAAHGRNAWTS